MNAAIATTNTPSFGSSQEALAAAKLYRVPDDAAENTEYERLMKAATERREYCDSDGPFNAELCAWCRQYFKADEDMYGRRGVVLPGCGFGASWFHDTCVKEYDIYHELDEQERREAAPALAVMKAMRWPRTDQQACQRTEKALERAGFEDGLTFGEATNGSTRLDYVNAKAAATQSANARYREASIIKRAYQAQREFLGLTLDEQKLYLSILTSDPDGHIRAMFTAANQLADGGFSGRTTLTLSDGNGQKGQ
jgi:hypothetical protein